MSRLIPWVAQATAALTIAGMIYALGLMVRAMRPTPPVEPAYVMPLVVSQYYETRDATQRLIRRRYKGNPNSAKARAYFRHMDSAYAPTYILGVPQ